MTSKSPSHMLQIVKHMPSLQAEMSRLTLRWDGSPIRQTGGRAQTCTCRVEVRIVDGLAITLLTPIRGRRVARSRHQSRERYTSGACAEVGRAFAPRKHGLRAKLLTSTDTGVRRPRLPRRITPIY